MGLGVEAEDRRAEQPVDDLLAPGADAEGLGIGPGDMPEGDDGRLGQPVADHARQQREMVVLHQDDRVLALGLGHDRIGEFLVHRAVELPVGFAEDRPHEGDVAERPEALVGGAVIIAVLLLFREPDPAQGVGRVIRRDGHPVVGVDHLPIRRAAAMGDPGAAAGAHHRLQGRHEAACGDLQRDLPCLGAVVDIGLAVRHHDDLGAGQLVGERRPQGIRAPIRMGGIDGPPGGFQLLEHVADFLAERDDVLLHGRLRIARAGALQRLPDGGEPSPHDEGRDHGGERRRPEGDTGKGQEEIVPRLPAALDRHSSDRAGRRGGPSVRPHSGERS